MESPEKSLAAVDAPPFEGERYHAEVPDTLDLTERAELAIHSITGMLEPDRGWLWYSSGQFARRPPVLVLSGGGACCRHKHIESLPLLRIISGSNSNIEVDGGFMRSSIRMVGEDGMVYEPPAMSAGEANPAPFDEPFGSIESEGRHILAICMWYQRDREPQWKRLVEKKIKRLQELAFEEEDFVYFTSPGWDNRKAENPAGMPTEVNFTARDTSETLKDPAGGRGRWGDTMRAHEVNFMLSRSLCVYYALTGYQPALELAGKTIRGVQKASKGFEEDGRWLESHFHTSAASLLAMLEYAMVTNDSDLLDFVNRGYEYGKAVGDPLVGFFAEFIKGSDRYLAGWGGYWPGEDEDFTGAKSLDPRDNTCESCEVADMIGLALKLTQAGAGDYWEDADRWVRNQYVENQLTPEKLRNLLASLDSRKLFREVPVQPWETEDVERSVGGWTGSALPNDWGTHLGHACCTGNAARTMYWIWDSILTREGDGVRVNLLLNRASPWLDLDSYLPYEGKVELKVKDASQVAVRIPEWTQRDRVACKVNDRERAFSWEGSYIRMDGLAAGDTVRVEFPMREKSIFSVIGDKPFKLLIKGNTVVEIDPPGPISPLYQRDRYRADHAPMKTVTRFVSRESIRW